MKPISTKTHGILDYGTVGVLYALPRVFGWNRRVTGFLTFMSAFLLGYSSYTRYELGIFKKLPMSRHLMFDAVSGFLMVLSPTFLHTHSRIVNAILIGLGLYEIGAAMTTESAEPSGPTQQASPEQFEIPIDVQEYVNG